MALDQAVGCHGQSSGQNGTMYTDKTWFLWMLSNSHRTVHRFFADAKNHSPGTAKDSASFSFVSSGYCSLSKPCAYQTRHSQLKGVQEAIRLNRSAPRMLYQWQCWYQNINMKYRHVQDFLGDSVNAIGVSRNLTKASRRGTGMLEQWEIYTIFQKGSVVAEKYYSRAYAYWSFWTGNYYFRLHVTRRMQNKASTPEKLFPEPEQ